MVPRHVKFLYREVYWKPFDYCALTDDYGGRLVWFEQSVVGGGEASRPTWQRARRNPRTARARRQPWQAHRAHALSLRRCRPRAARLSRLYRPATRPKQRTRARAQ